MKKILAIMLVAVFAATGAYADDRLQLSGQMRVQGLSIENYGDFNDNTKGDEQDYWRQRFRTAAKINVAEGVSVNLRFDFAEDTWGSNNWAGVRYNADSELQVDRAYLDVSKEMFQIKAGQQYFGLGNSIVIDSNATGFNLGLKLPVAVNLIYIKSDEGGANSDNDTGVPASFALNTTTGVVVGTAATTNSEDTDIYAMNVGYASDAFTVNGFYAISKDNSPADNSPSVFGLQGTAALGPVNLNAELDIFGGDQTAAIDYFGTQFSLDANMAMGAGKVGAFFLYAAGTDTPATETQKTMLSDFGSYAPLSFGILEFTDWCPIQDGNGNDVFDFTGASAGVVGFAPYGEFKPMEGFYVRGLLGYLTPQEDNITTVDNAWVFNLGLQYDFAPNTAVLLSYNYTKVEFDTAATSDDPATGLFSEIRVNF
jgi:opacity protein-like surface antigen